MEKSKRVMFKLTKPCKNEDGYFLIISTLMLMALLAIISFSASRNANTEVQSAGNAFLYERNFYLAEGAALQAVDRLQNEPEPRGLNFVVPGTGSLTDDNLETYWDGVDQTGDTRFMVSYEGIPPGYSLAMSNSKVHAFTLYGRTTRQGEATVKVGYLKAY